MIEEILRLFKPMSSSIGKEGIRSNIIINCYFKVKVQSILELKPYLRLVEYC